MADNVDLGKFAQQVDFIGTGFLPDKGLERLMPMLITTRSCRDKYGQRHNQCSNMERRHGIDREIIT